MDNSGVRRIWGGHLEIFGQPYSRVVLNVCSDRNFFLVVIQAVTASNYYLVMEVRRAPVKTKFRTKIIVLRVPGVCLCDCQSGQIGGADAGRGPICIVLAGVERAKIRPA